MAAATAGALRYRIATRLGFFMPGFAAAAWAPLIPFAKARTGVDNGVLGLVLLAAGIGSIATMPLIGALAHRFGCRRVIAGCTLITGICLPLLAWVSSLPLLVAALFAFGAGVGGLDVTINIQSVVVEREAGTPMMSGFHGFYSVGGIAGAAGMTALLALGAYPLAAAWAAAGVCVALGASAIPGLLAEGSAGGPSLAFPRGIVWFLGALAFILFLVEGSVADWSAVFLTSVRGMPRAYAGLGFAAFAGAMTSGRLTGDLFVHRLGGWRVVLLGTLCAAAGFAVANLAPGWPAALAGYALVGIGCSNAVPVLYTATGRQTAMPESQAVSAMSTMGYAGMLAGPALIGLVARAAGLPWAFTLVILMLLGVAAAAPRLRS
ncbi:MAG TPA: MFS transporter [Caulobacteraceae bacterium]|nr:MFS transporter [Caulobacteraceae bacterium]